MGYLIVDNVSKIYDKGKPTEKAVLNNVSLTINKGEFVCFLGPSGCGKTTLLSMTGGFNDITSGQILLDNEKVKGPSIDKAYVFQNYALFPWFTVKQNIEYGMKFLKIPKEEKQKKIEDLLNMARLKEHINKYPIQLSGGMQQRVAVARALAGQPKLLLLDEPLGAIDFQMRELMQNQLDDMVQKSKITAVMVTHDVSESVFMSDRVIVIGNNCGNIIADVHIDLPRRRDRECEKYEKYVEELTKLVREAFSSNLNRMEEL